MTEFEIFQLWTYLLAFLFVVAVVVLLVLHWWRYHHDKRERNSRPPTPRIGHLEINDHVWIDNELWTMTNYSDGVAGEDNRPPRMVLKMITPVSQWDQYR